MSELVADCPRCGAREITFDLLGTLPTYVEYGWQHWFEAFCICRKCSRSTVFVLSQQNSEDKAIIKEGLAKYDRAVNRIVKIEHFICIRDIASVEPPLHLPESIESAFKEGATCLATGCYNATAGMFRLCVDLATKSFLPVEGEGQPNARTRRNLGLRLPWLFDNGHLPESLRELSTCIKEDGNDGAHDGTLRREDAADLLDFTKILLERIYTEPKQLEEAKVRREERRS